MALQKCSLNLNKDSKELQPHGTLAFPCAGYSARYTDRQEDIIPWHWHEEIEIMYVKDGQMKVKVPAKSFLLRRGDCIVINANMLHSCAAVPECQLHSLVFSPTLITGSDELAFAKKYILPLLSCGSFSGCHIEAENNETVARWFCEAFEAVTQDCFGFEFIVRENLSRICLFLYEIFEPQIERPKLLLNQDNLRIRQMLAYIHKNFAADLSLSEISDVAGISQRECLRCFQKTIQLSPIQYLLKYRVMRGAEMLSKNFDNSISEIAVSCGFDSPSNFSQTFKRFYNCTPREYRNINMK